MRHRGAIGLHEQVVDEVGAEVDVLEARQELGALRLGEARPEQVDRVELAPAPGQLGPGLAREDLLPAVVALERRQVRGADEALRPVVEARPRRRARQPLDERPQEARRPPDALGEEVGRVRVVAAEELVAALSGERDLHVLGRKLRDEVGREGRRVGEGLVEGLGEGGEQERRVGLEHELPVLSAVALRHEPRVGELVEAPLLEADRERAQRLRRLLGRERREHRGVDAAREEHADRHVGDEVRADRVAQARPQLLDELRLLVVRARRTPGPGPAARSG